MKKLNFYSEPDMELIMIASRDILCFSGDSVSGGDQAVTDPDGTEYPFGK